MWKRILVPHDFSELGAKALGLAAKLASQCDAELLLFHVTDLAGEIAPGTLLTPEGTSAPVRVDEYTARGALRQLEAIAARSGIARVRCEVDFGDVGERILAAIDRYDVDAVVIATHGRKGIMHALLGSVAEYVIGRATVPVVTCRGYGGAAELSAEEIAAQDELAG